MYLIYKWINYLDDIINSIYVNLKLNFIKYEFEKIINIK